MFYQRDFFFVVFSPKKTFISAIFLLHFQAAFPYATRYYKSLEYQRMYKKMLSDFSWDVLSIKTLKNVETKKVKENNFQLILFVRNNSTKMRKFFPSVFSFIEELLFCNNSEWIYRFKSVCASMDNSSIAIPLLYVNLYIWWSVDNGKMTTIYHEYVSWRWGTHNFFFSQK